MKNARTRLTLISVSALAAAALAACGGGGGSAEPAPAPAPTTGTLNVGITDAPACGFDAVNVTVSRVRVHQSSSASETGTGWSEVVLAPARKINLLNLTNGVLENLGQTTLPAGKYTQVRLVLDANTGNSLANSVVPTGTTAEQSLDTPSAVQSGIKLVGDFDVVAGQQANLVLDFDACKSVLTKGNGKYALKPVVKLLPSVLNGISGYVNPTASSGVTVSAQQNGVVISSTAPTAAGDFMLSRLAPGSYDVVITGADRAATVISRVPVATTTSITALSTAAAPIPLAPSTTAIIGGRVTLNPVSATEAAYVTAKQTFVAGPTVTVKYQGADLSTGAYSLNLPVALPLYAVYSPTLPMTFAPNTLLMRGVYQVEASATGYATKPATAPIDVSAVNATDVNFTLTP